MGGDEAEETRREVEEELGVAETSRWLMCTFSFVDFKSNYVLTFRDQDKGDERDYVMD